MKSKKIIKIKKTGFFSVLKYKNSFVLIKKARGPFKGRWDLPGGKAEFGETPEEALEREIKEETGLKVKNSKLDRVISYNYKYKTSGGKIEWLYHTGIIYTCKAGSLKGLKDEADGQDSLGARVFTKKEISKLKLTPLAEKMLRNK